MHTKCHSSNVLLEEVLANKFFQVPPEASEVGGLVSLTIVVRTIIFHFRKCRVVLDRLRAPYPWLVLDGIEDFIDGEPQWGGVLFRPESSKWTWRKD